MMKQLAIAIALSTTCLTAMGQDDPFSIGELPSFEVKDGDRVVFLGSEFIERATKFNFLEAELTARWPDRRVSFFNMGWSGDDPTAIARGYFGGADEGFTRLVAELDRIKPTVAFLCYGSNFEGTNTGEFAANFKKLYAAVRKHAKRVVVVSPPPAETRRPPRPNAAVLNNPRRAVTKMLQFLVVSELEGSPFFVNIFKSLERRLTSLVQPLTTDGIRFTEEGYAIITRVILQQLRVKKTPARDRLVEEKYDKLRELIAEKNQLYFHRYRPQNETYLRGFRKHEQGQNAKEIAEFDALIAKAEDRIYAFLNDKPMPPPIPEPPPIELSFTAATPDEERAEFTLAEGLEASLFASEPMVSNPIHMNFDNQGRLWVASSPIYPQLKPGAKPRDEIVVLEDTDGDGVADKRTVFADDLLIPTAVLPDENGGAYVANSTELVHLMDTDKDGKADRRQVVFAGFGTEDTHHILHTFRWGPDAAIYFNQSIYIHTHMETPEGVKRLMGSGIWRYDRRKGTAEVVMRGLVNPWGHVFDKYGQSFATDGAGGDGINYAFLGSAYPTAVGYSRVMRGMNPGQPKHCGLEVISGSHWPDDWQGTVVTSDFRGNRINRFQLSEEGSGYVSKQMPDLLTSKHRAFRPVDLKMGLDGALYVADWYNPIINHGEVDFRDSRRDYKHGRIWRVSVRNEVPTPKPDFRGSDTDTLVAMLGKPELRTRQMARIELLKRSNFDVRFALEAWVRGLAKDDYDGLLEALWTYESRGSLNTVVLGRVLSSPDHRHRAAAVRVVGHLGERVPEFEKIVRGAVADKHPQVRLEALAILRSIPSAQAAELAMSILDQPMDKNLDFALWHTMRELETQWLPTLGTDAPVDFQKDKKKLLFALRAVGNSRVAAPLVRLLTSDTLGDEDSAEVVQMLGRFGGPKELEAMFDLAVANEPLRGPALNALISAAGRGVRGEPTSETAAELAKLSDSPQVLHLAGLWNVPQMKAEVLDAALSKDGATQMAAIRGLAGYKDVGGLREVISMVSLPINVRRSAIAQLATVDENAAAAEAASFLGSLGSNQTKEAEQLVGAFLSRRNGPAALARAVRTISLMEPIAAAAVRRASSSGRKGKPLVDALRSAGSVEAMKTDLSAQEMADLIAEVSSKGNPQRGENVYRRDALGCIKCHAIGGAGGIVGPDMVSLGASSPVDYIIESMLKPSAKIKEGYHTTTVLTDSGTQVSGKLISEDGEKVVIRDADNKEFVIPVDSIDERVKSPTSLMPVDLVAKLPRSEFVDLIAFLSALGKEGPYKVPANLYARKWQIKDGPIVYSKVDGSIPASVIAGKTATLEIEVTTPGTIGLLVANPDGLRITWNDLKDNLRAEKIVLDLPAGRHRFSFAVAGRRKQPLRVEVLTEPQFTGRAVPVNQ